MTYRESVVRGRVQSEHVVQLFDSIESLAETVGDALAAGYAKGDGLLVVAKLRNWTTISARLAERSLDVERMRRSERLHVLDAVDTLKAISRRDVPDAELFETVIGTKVRRLSAVRPLAIYGEMVEILAEEGDFASALKLEDLWNELAERHSFRLLCGYSAAHFAAPGQETTIRKVCAAHTHVRTAPGDPLAAWLVRLTRTPLRVVHGRR